jgi:acetyl-CoA carboxylase carboxyltransferase component
MLSSRKPLRAALPPAYDPEELLSIVNPDIRKPMNMMEVILRIVDGSGLELFKPNFGRGMVTAWAYIHGTDISKQKYPSVQGLH